MKLSLYTPVYATTLLLSAALLFSVQPLFSKMILPLLGGTPQVWNTAMLFFQIMLLGGYAYAHGTSKYLGIRTQAVLHIALLCLFFLVLPIAIPQGWVPPVNEDPTLWQLSLMAGTVGGPFFVLAGSAPMLQRWFARTDHPDAKDPYFLYGASNLGSMTALLAYPTIVEPLLDVPAQSNLWTASYVTLILFTALSAFLVWTHSDKKVRKKKDSGPSVTWAQRRYWLILAFIPSSLMLGVTTFITTDIAAVPLLWIMPLALYVGTFIIVFARSTIIPKKFILTLQAASIVLFLGLTVFAYDMPPVPMILLQLCLFFFTALACHTALAESRPSASKLTEFYLIMSAGGALGGFFNAIIAPVFFILPIEYGLILAAAILMRYAGDKDQSFGKWYAALQKTWKKKGIDSVFSLTFMTLFFAIFAAGFSAVALHDTVDRISAFVVAGALIWFMEKRWLFALLCASVLFFYPPGYDWNNPTFKNTIYRDRNFFGVIKVVDSSSGERLLLHGTTNHGTQPLDPKLKLIPLSYYSKNSPLNTSFKYLDRKPGSQKIAILGLGIGVTACKQKQGRHFDFFEIDPQIAAIAQDAKYFTYLADCKSPYRIIPGDGRLTLKDQPDYSYDLILLDAFSSDNIPVHLLTKEALQLYMQKLRPGGILIYNISNNYLDIEPVLTNLAASLEIPAYAAVNPGGKIEGTELTYYPAHFFSISRDKDYIKFLETQGWSPARQRTGVGLWTDQFSNIVSVLENKTGLGRLRELVKKEKAAAEKTKKK